MLNIREISFVNALLFLQVPTQRVQLQQVSQQQLQASGGRAQIVTAQPISFATVPRIAASSVTAIAGGSTGYAAAPHKRHLDYYYDEPRLVD